MNSIPQKLRFAVLIFLAFALTLSTGCGSGKDPNKNSDESFRSGKRIESVKVTPVSNFESQKPVVIEGDLSVVNWNSLIGRQITVKGELVVVDTYDLARRGQVVVARERLFVPTAHIDPNDKDPKGTSFQGGNNVAEVAKAQKFNDNGTLIIDDGSPRQNIFPPALFPNLGKKSLPTVRLGSTVKGVSGKLIKAGPKLLLIPNKRLKWKMAKRPKRPSVGKADITIASYNVLNYFTTIDNGSNRARGADSASEFKRQEAKIVAALKALDADVIGLMELENNGVAENRLVDALNKKVGKKVYKGCGVPAQFQRAYGGGDAIRVGIIYRSDRVKPVGGPVSIHNRAFSSARAPLCQTFKAKKGGKPFTLVVNHFKSKGGADRADPENKNKGDGQGAYNAARRGQAFAVYDFVKSLGKGRVLVIGDLNAYQEEDPVDALRAKGMIDLHAKFEKSDEKSKNSKSNKAHYSYVYRGQCGSLDHALGTKSLVKDVTGVATWHINSDEPRFMDYNLEYNPRSLYKPDLYRSSDHDPVLIGIKK